jgi:hypothetical protein
MKKQFIAAAALLVLMSGGAVASTYAHNTYLSVATVEALGNEAQSTTSSQVLPNGPISPVPLPAAGWMLLAGVGGLVALRRRAKA